MNKPITMVRKELGEKLDDLINEYLQNVPAFIIRPIIQNVDRQLEEIEKRQLEADQKAYEEAQAESKKAEPVEGEVVDK